MNIISYVPFETNREFRDFMSASFKGEGYMYIQVAEDMNDSKSVMNAQPVPLSFKSCRVIKDSQGNTSMVFNGRGLRLMLDWEKLRVVKDNKKKLLGTIEKVKNVLGDVPIAAELEERISNLALSVEDLYNKNEQLK